MIIRHTIAGRPDAARSREIRALIRRRIICFGGNRKLKIYGTLHCRSGKKMQAANRIFFSSEEEAVQAGYRPCAHCMGASYNYRKAAR